MKLAYISTMNGMPWGGSEALWHASARHALEEGHQVLTITQAWPRVSGPIKELSALGATTLLRPGYNPDIKIRLYRRLKSLFVQQSPELKKLTAFAPDRLVVNQGGGYDLLDRPELVAFLLATKVPFYILVHNYNEERVLDEVEQSRLRQLFMRARQVFMICRLQAEAIQKQIVTRLPNISIVNNPQNLSTSGLLPAPDTSVIQFASVATFHVDRKGQDILLEVLSREEWKERKWHLNFYGEGPHESYIKALVKYYGLEQRVAFKGHVKDISALWRENHILLLSSRIETGPMVLTEAMLCGRPAVATRVGKVPELIREGYNGYIAGAATPGLYHEAMERAWQAQSEWPLVSANAHRTANDHLDMAAGKTFLRLVTA